MAERARMTRVMCNGVTEPSWGHTWPLGTHSWGRHPAREQMPVGGEHVQPGDTYCQGTCPCRLRAHPLVGEMALPGDTSLGGADTAKGHSGAEATHPRGTQAPLSLLWRCPSGGLPAPTRPATRLSPVPMGLPPCHVQNFQPATGNQLAVGSPQSGVTPSLGRGHPGVTGVRAAGWGWQGAPRPQGLAPRNLPPQAPHGLCQAGGSCLGACPPPGQEGVKGLLQLCVQMCDMQMRPSGFYKAGAEAAPRTAPAPPRR